MKISQISVQYHKELNPKLWDGMKLKQEVRQKLLQIVKEFIKFCDIPEFEPDIVYMTGSLCAYNYTSGSDVDVHIKLNFKDFPCPDIVEQMFDAKRDVFTDKFDITIYGFPVEVYVQDITDENIAAGEYDLIKDKWLEKPQYSPPDIDGREIKQKSASLRRKIAKVVANEVGYKDAKGLMKRIKAWRKAALEDGGEFSSENLVFKALRKDGSINKLLDYIKTVKSEELSLEESKDEFENNPTSLRNLYRVQMARSTEYYRVCQALHQKYPEHSSEFSILPLKSMILMASWQDDDWKDDWYPLFMPDQEFQALKKKFLRMINAKKAYENAADQATYSQAAEFDMINKDKKAIHEHDEFENKPVTLKQLFKVQAARTLEWCRARDAMWNKYNIVRSTIPYKVLQNTKTSQINFPLFGQTRELTQEDNSKLRATADRMMTAKRKYEEGGGKYNSTDVFSEGVEEFENKPESLVQLYKVQAARCLEWCRFRDIMYSKYGINLRVTTLTPKEIQLGKARDFKYPSFLDRDDIEQRDHDKLKKVFWRMIEAKKKYENRGGGYDGWKL